MAAPVQNASLEPTMAEKAPVPVAATIEDARKAVVGQLMRSAPPTPMTMLGKTVAVSSTFIECSSTPPRSTASGSAHCDLSNACQPGSIARPCIGDPQGNG